jgi:hypothetical protein
MRILAFALLSAVLAAVGGCGGHDHGPAVPPTAGTVPPSALASPAAYTAFVGQLPADDMAEPLDLEGVTPPVSDTDEPEDV